MLDVLSKQTLWSSLRPAHYVFAAILCARLVVLARLAGSESPVPEGGDAQFYDEWAQRIAAGEWTDHRAFYGLPLYAYWLAILYKICGHNAFVAVLIQAAIDSATGALIFSMGCRLFEAGGRRVAMILSLAAAVGWALFLPAQAYSMIVMPTVFGVFVFSAVLFYLIKCEGPPTARACFCAGLALGFTAMAIATCAVLAALVAAAIFLKRDPLLRRAAGSRVAALLLLGCGLAAGSAPCWMHNFFVAREPVVLSAHAGVNFWVGNNAEATGYPHFPGLRAGQSEMLTDSIAIAQKTEGRALTRSEVSAFWSAKARRDIRADPARWATLLLKKISNFWNAFEYDDLSIVARLQEEKILLPGVRFGLIAALGFVGAAFAVRRSPPARWIAGAVALQMAAVLPVFVTERYRLVAVPGLLLFAVFGVAHLWRALKRFDFKPAIAYLALLSATTAFVSIPRSDPNLWALLAYNSGRRALDRGDLARAETDLFRARAYAPGNGEVSFALGNLKLAQGDRLAARSFYHETLAGEPSHKRALNNLGLIALEDGHPEEAESYLRRALSDDQGSAATRYLLARALYEERKTEAANAEISGAIKLKPDQPEFIALRAAIEQDLARPDHQ